MDLLQLDPIGRAGIWKIPASGGPAIQVSAGLGIMAIESADGAYLYYTESQDHKHAPPRCGAFRLLAAPP